MWPSSASLHDDGPVNSVKFAGTESAVPARHQESSDRQLLHLNCNPANHSSSLNPRQRGLISLAQSSDTVPVGQRKYRF